MKGPKATSLAEDRKEVSRSSYLLMANFRCWIYSCVFVLCNEKENTPNLKKKHQNEIKSFHFNISLVCNGSKSCWHSVFSCCRLSVDLAPVWYHFHTDASLCVSFNEAQAEVERPRYHGTGSAGPLKKPNSSGASLLQALLSRCGNALLSVPHPASYLREQKWIN